MNTSRLAIVALTILCAASMTCGGSPTAIGEVDTEVSAPESVQLGQHALLVGAGDHVFCDYKETALATAILARSLGGTVMTLGDHVYLNGTANDFATCYDQTWGLVKDRTRPSPGNHDYHTPGAAGYYGYFGDAAGPDRRGYYSYELGDWHIVSLNSNVDASPSSAQAAWLTKDLQARGKACVLAYWHHPTFSSDNVFDGKDMRPIWQILYSFGAAVVVNGHYHAYERFAPQAPDGRVDPKGIREFIVGTGGAFLVPRRTIALNSEVFDATSRGVIQFKLASGSYEWAFHPTDGKFTDSGSGTCPALESTTSGR